jgi:hypothetical protein
VRFLTEFLALGVDFVANCSCEDHRLGGQQWLFIVTTGRNSRLFSLSYKFPSKTTPFVEELSGFRWSFSKLDNAVVT